VADNTVVSLNASVVHVDVYVELLTVSVNVNLSFGPFDRIADAQKWADELDHFHAQKQLIVSDHEEELLLDGNGMPLRSYQSAHMSILMISEHKGARKLAKYLLAPDAPEKVEPLLAEYAVRAANEATSFSCFLFDKEK
jgi:hypothetical protein